MFNSSVNMVWILVYVDNLIIMGNNEITIEEVIKLICEEFSCKDLGMLNYFLGTKLSY